MAIRAATRSSADAENFDVFDFDLTPAQLDSIDGPDKGVRGGPAGGPSLRS